MANLPQNTTYGDNSNLGVISALRDARAKYPALSVPTRTSTSEATSSGGYNAFKGDQANIPTGQAFVPATSPHSPIPQNYGTFDKNWDQPSKDAHLLSIGGGQMVTDPSQPGSFIKTERADLGSDTYDSQGRARLLGNRSSSLYQIDHIVPLWAGGADTDANKQTLTWAEHDRKTRAQAVALTLLANKKISQKEALLLAVSWKDRDVSEVPPVSEKTGMLDPRQAQDTYTLWKKQEKEGKPVTFKDFIAAIPEATKKVGDNLVPDWLPGHKYLEAGVQGLASGLSFGWIPGVSQEGNVGEQGAGIVGNIIGMAIPIGWATRILGGGVKAASAANKAKEIGEASGLFKVFPNTSRVAGAIPPVFMKEAILKNAAKMTIAAQAYGQLSPEGFAGVMAGDERAEPWTRLAEDTIYGVITGVIKPTAVGSMKVAGLAAATSLMFDPDHPQDALVNGLLMGGFHLAAGRVGIPREAEALANKSYKNSEAAFKAQTEAVDHVAADALEKFVGSGKVPRDPVTGDLFPQGYPEYSSEVGTIEKLTKQANAKIDEMAVNTNLTFQEVAEMRTAVSQYSRLLYERGLTPENRAYAQAEDYVSAAAAIKRLEDVNTKIGESPTAIEAGRAMDEKLLTSSFINDASPDSSGLPVGTHRLTGMSSDTSSRNYQNVTEYLDSAIKGGAVDGWRSSPTLIVVDRSETSPFWRMQSERIKKDIEEGIKNTEKNQTPYQNPQNALEVYGVKYNEATGERVTVPLAWIARKSRIEQPDYKYAFNNDKWVKNGTFPRLDEGLNKDSIADAMRSKGLKTLFVNLDRGHSGKEAAISGEPYMHITINDANWNASLEYAKAARGVQKAEGMPALLHETTHGVTAKHKQEAISEIKDRVKDPADVVLSKAGQLGDESVYQEATVSFLNDVRNVVDSSETVPDMKRNFEDIGVFLTDEEAMTLTATKEDITVKDILDTIFKKARGENRISREMDYGYREFILPFLNSPAYKGWELRPAFPHMKLLGGLPAAKPPKTAYRAAEPIKTPTEIAQEAAPQQEQMTLDTASPEVPGAPTSPDAQVSTLASRIAEQARLLPTEEQVATVQPAQAPPIQKSTRIPVQQVPLTGKEPGVNISWKSPSVDVSKKVSTKSPQQEAVDSAMEEMTTRIFDKVDNMVVPDTAEAYASRIGTILKTIMPGGKTIDAKGRPVAFSNAEIANMKKSIMARYYPEFESRVTRSFDPIEEIMFSTKSLPGDESVKDAMVSLVHAKAAKSMGNIDRYNEIVLGMDEDIKNEAVKYFANGDESLATTMFQPVLPKEVKKSVDPLFPNPEEGVNYSPSEIADMEATRRKRGAALGSIRENEGKTFIKNVEEATKADPSSDTFARGFATDEMLKNFFGEDYKKDKKVVRDIGEAFSGRGFSAKSAWGKLYETTDRSGSFKEYTQPKEYLEALAEGSEPKKARAEAKRKMELNAIKDAEDINASIPDDLLKEVYENNMRVARDAQTGDSALPVTYGESKGALYPSAGYVDNPTTEHGLTDARSVIQQFMARYNDMVSTKRKRGDASARYINLGKKTSSKRWDDMSEKQKAYAMKEIKDGTNKKIEEIRAKITRIIESGKKQTESSN